MNLPIPTYIINLEKRADRKKHILREFRNKTEFDIQIVKAIDNEDGAQGLWLTIEHIIGNLIDHDRSYFLLIEDDHQFTEQYSYQFLSDCINQAQSFNADILLGGVSWFDAAVPISDHLFWVDKFNATQFVVIYKPFYKKFLDNKDKYTNSADINISNITDNKFVIHPFISTQFEFGYSDATSFNDINGYVTKIFSESDYRLGSLLTVKKFYQGMWSKQKTHFK